MLFQPITQKCTIVLLLLFGYISSSKAIDTDTVKAIKELQGSNKEKQIKALWSLTRYHATILSNTNKADSLAELAVSYSELHKDKCLILASYINYGTYYAPNKISNAKQLVEKAIALAEKEKNKDLLFDANVRYANILYNQKNKKGAIDQMLMSATLLQNDTRRNFWYHMSIAEMHDDFTELITALQHYNDALQYATKLKNDSLQLYTHTRIIRLAAKSLLKQKAQSHIEKAKELIASSKTLSDYDKLYFESMEQTYLATFQDPALFEKGEQLLDKCTKNGFGGLFDEVLGNLRMSFMKNDDRKSLCSLYCQPKYYMHLQSLKQKQEDLYLRIQALLQEDRGQIDSARWYWLESERALKKVEVPAYQANFYYRYAQFNFRQKDYNKTDTCLSKAQQLAESTNFFPLLIDISKLQEANYNNLGNISMAYEALKRNRNYSDSSFNRLEQEKINLIEENSSKQLEEIATSIKKEEKNRRFTLQMFIVGLIGILLLYALVVFSKKQISISAIKMMGYITFVFLFEFLVFLLHKVFYKITEEPIILVFMNIALIAILLPIHHATEHRVMHYLLQRHRVHNEPTSLKKWLTNIFTKYKKWLNVSEHG